MFCKVEGSSREKRTHKIAHFFVCLYRHLCLGAKFHRDGIFELLRQLGKRYATRLNIFIKKNTCVCRDKKKNSTFAFEKSAKRLEDVLSITDCAERSGAVGHRLLNKHASGRRYLAHDAQSLIYKKYNNYV